MRRGFGRVGAVVADRRFLVAPGDPRLHAASAIASPSPRAYLPRPLDDDYGAMGFDADQARAAAVGELFERTACAYHPGDRLERATARALGPRAVGMDAFAMYAPDAHDTPGWPLARYSADAPIHWVAARRLADGAPRWVPAAVVYVPRPALPAGDRLCAPVSTGQACHTTRPRAVLSGLYEVVERDAFMITWLRRLPLPRVDFRADAHLNALYTRYFAGARARFHVFDMTLDVALPTALCVAEAQADGGPLFAVGAATRATGAAAVEKALLEAAQDLVWVRDLVRRRPRYEPRPDYADVTTFEDHVRLFADPRMRAHLAFLLDGAREVPLRPRDAGPELEVAVGALDRVGLDPLVVDLTRADAVAAGLTVVKVLVPGAVPLTAAHAVPAHGSPRLWAVPERAGYGGVASATLNPVPHPFP